MAEDTATATAPVDDERTVHDSWGKAGLDPDSAFDATRATRNIAGTNVVAQIRAELVAMRGALEARIEVFEAQMWARMEAFEARMEAFEARMLAVDARIEALQRQIIMLQWMVGLLGLLVSGGLVAVFFAILNRPDPPVLTAPPAVVAPAVDPAPAPVQLEPGLEPALPAESGQPVPQR